MPEGMSTLVDRMVRAAKLDATLYEEVESDHGSRLQALGVVIISSVAFGLGTGAGIGGLVTGTIAAVLGWYLWAFITYLIGTRLLPEPADLHDETRFCASFAAGAKLWLGAHLGLRAEARGLFTVLDSDRQTFCQTAEGCVVQSSGSEMSQVELHAGLVLRF